MAYSQPPPRESQRFSVPPGAKSAGKPFRRPLLAPEVIQISSIDCGVAATACLLRGCGIPANYERLREACQTDVDGTSIDTLQEIINRIGFQFIQHLLPEDSFLSEAEIRLPAIVPVSTPGGAPHFVVLWRRTAGYWQVMDPSRGRRWLSDDELRQSLHRHVQTFDPREFREWAEQSSFLDALQKRLWKLTSRRDTDRLLKEALSDATWRSLAALDAAARFVAAVLDEARGGAWVSGFLDRTFRQALAEVGQPKDIPAPFWSVREVRNGQVIALAGSVMLANLDAESPRPPAIGAVREMTEDSEFLHRALSEPETSTFEVIYSLLGSSAPIAAGMLIALTAVLVFLGLIEVLVVRIALTNLVVFSQIFQKVSAVAWLFSLFGALLAAEYALTLGQRRLGRAIEIRIRLALFSALPSLDDEFIRSRPTSDLAQRAQLIHLSRDLPQLLVTMLRGAADLVATIAVVASLDRYMAIAVCGASALLGLVGYVATLSVAEIERKLQANSAALLQVFQDALLGVVPLRVHGAEAALRREHRSRLLPWLAAARQRLSQSTLAGAFQGIAVAILLVAILLRGQVVFADGVRFVMLLFWVLRLPTAAQSLLASAQALPPYRLAVARALEPVRGGRRRRGVEGEYTSYGIGARGASFRFDDVQVVAAGRLVLDDVSLTIRPGEHVAIVGRSGAGKSTFLSLLLGLRTPSYGNIYVDGVLLEGEELHALRRQTAWIDPNVQLWNDTFLANLNYGQEDGSFRSMNSILELSDLFGVVERLPNGLMTVIGNDGALLSGGEGQRIRVGRALTNRRPRVALLDEPFRGLDRDLRKKLLANMREIFVHETLITVTHDVEHVTEFDRVLVIENGRIIEDGDPAELLGRASRFSELVEADIRNKDTIWSDQIWQRISVEGGKIADGDTREEDDEENTEEAEDEDAEDTEEAEDEDAQDTEDARGPQ